MGAVTEGARASSGLEIEFVPAPLQPADLLAGKLFGVLRYLLIKGAVLNNGDTIGQGETEAIRVRFRERGSQFDGRVLELTLEKRLANEVRLHGLGGSAYAKTAFDRSRTTFGRHGRD